MAGLWTRGVIFGIGLMLLVTGLVVACKPAAESGKPARVRIGFVVKQPDEAWFQNEWKFAQQCADRYGFDLLKIGATDGEKALAAIDNLAAQQAQGLVLCTPDVRLGPALQAKAQSYGMKLYAVDDQLLDAAGRPMELPYMGLSARQIGRTVGQALIAECRRRQWPLAETAACAVTFDELNTCKERTDGAAQALIEAGLPADKIFRTPEKTSDVPGGFDAANTLLTQHPELRRWLVFSVNDEGVLGAVRALESRGLGRQAVVAIGIGGVSALPEFEKPEPSGFFATCLISPRRHGYETTERLYQWITQGTAPPLDIRTAGLIVTRDNYRALMSEQGLLGGAK